ncbi:hypothetical protein CC77DRAFT_1025344 [Alternaria alternata]|jgi:hypothetical protein|uniref:YDG domain-containing protein n=2 Tax=Alternaria alternata complex TaxID=187734 RepID=A0A177D6C2_ALTAL|nr:hypothetical protein CC77DRAFT_1025344 [Alternaria alternata]XP_051585139.1 uncharacterized protein J4E82_008895 [Alternaria postmessia]RYN33322.1 hypothetical protein AA0115_g3116 [Alternaria tenuissima]KAI5372436.1 hypothetical protein J4E82_008895 [Alternaria postmessia]OAG15008.1 hypothetical protein CC77DRAFT_1025344 [Alternaria alternata]RYN80442.1 hypothetical protein AA0117_g3090 [Alternaria alternata]
MPPPESQNIAEPPAWLLEKAQNAEKASVVGPDAWSRIIQKTRAHAEANSEEHQNSMRLLGKKMNELRAKYDLNPFKNVEQQPSTSDDFVVQPKAIIPAQNGIKRKASTQAHIPEDPRAKKPRVQKTQSSQEDISKKAKADAEKQAKCRDAQQKKDDAYKKSMQNVEERADKVEELRRPKDTLKEKPASTVFAEASTTGTSPDRTAAQATTAIVAANKPDTTNTIPSNALPVSESNTDRYAVRAPLPEWYTSISMKGHMMEAMSKKRPPELTSLEALKTCIRQCEDTNSAIQLDKLYDALRDHVHKAEIRLEVNRFLVRKANMLSPEYGLPRIFRAGTDFPWDLKADAYQLYNRWWKNDLNQDILRGIVSNKTGNRTSDRLDETYRKRFSIDAKHYGNGDLVQGQWWPTQLCTVRDGAHGSAQGGIYGEKERGAYSIVLSGGNGYQDVDNGDVIDYSGTPGKNSTPTENTIHLLKSADLGNQIRVVRSAQLNKKNKYRPELGLRYDGLYRVTSYTKTDQETAMYKFRLERCEGQDPIRFEGKAKRPSFYEVKEYERLKDRV